MLRALLILLVLGASSWGADGAKISDLPSVVVSDGTEVVPVVQSGMTKKATIGALSVTASGASSPRTLANRWADRFSVKDFGAKGDGATDNTTFIQAGIEALNAIGGGTLYFPAGTYLTGKISLRPAVALCGDGPQSTIIKLKNSTNDNLLVDYNWQNNVAFSSYPYYISDLTLDGNKANNSAGTVLTIQSFASRFENVKIMNAAEDGIRITVQTRNGTTIGNTVPNNRFDTVHVTGCNKRAVYGADTSGTILADEMFIGCIFDTCGDSGYDQVVTDRAAGWTFTDCRWYSGYRGDLNLSRMFNTQVTGCNFELDAREAANASSNYANIILGVDGANGTVTIKGCNFWTNPSPGTATDTYCALYATSAQNALAIVGNGFVLSAGTNRKIFQNNGALVHTGYFSDNCISGYTLPDDLGTGADRLVRSSLAVRKYVYGNDFTTYANNFLFKPQATNESLNMGLGPNGTGNFAMFACYGTSDPETSHYAALEAGAAYEALHFGVRGAGTAQAGRITVGSTTVLNFPAAATNFNAPVPFCADGGLTLKTRTLTANTTLTTADGVVLVDATSGSVTITLSFAGGMGSGRSQDLRIRRIDASANTVTVQRQSADTLNGGTSETLAAGVGKTYVASGGTAWYSW